MTYYDSINMSSFEFVYGRLPLALAIYEKRKGQLIVKKLIGTCWFKMRVLIS